ncbi:MAG: hypothetical protein ACRDRO_27030 [Pseudonocardiaceae bacterium]
MAGADGVGRARAEKGHQRDLGTVFGTVAVIRIAYCAPGSVNLYPADAALNLPVGKHSHGFRRLVALEAARVVRADRRGSRARDRSPGR